METIDKRAELFELEEIYKYKDLISITDKDTIKRVICSLEEGADVLHERFISLVEQEMNHELNKTEFASLKDKLIAEMNAFLA